MFKSNVSGGVNGIITCQFDNEMCVFVYFVEQALTFIVMVSFPAK